MPEHKYALALEPGDIVEWDGYYQVLTCDPDSDYLTVLVTWQNVNSGRITKEFLFAALSLRLVEEQG